MDTVDDKVVKELSRNIWITSKCRFNASGRLGRYSTHATYLITWYSAFILIVSIYDAISPHQGTLNVLLISASLLVLVGSLLVSQNEWAARAISMQYCGKELKGLYGELQAHKRGDQFSLRQEDYKSFSTRYDSVLHGYENHHPVDYLSHALSDVEIKGSLPLKNKASYWIRSIWVSLIVLTLYLMPAAGIIRLFSPS